MNSDAMTIVNQFYEVSLKQKDAEGIRPFLTDDFRFVGPLDQRTGADGFVELNKGFLPFMMDTRMQQQFVTGDHVCSIYEIDVRTPAGETLTLEMADWVLVQNGRMVEQHIYYDPRPFVAAFGM